MSKSEVTNCKKYVKILLKGSFGFAPALDKIILLEVGRVGHIVDYVLCCVGSHYYSIRYGEVQIVDDLGFRKEAI